MGDLWASALGIWALPEVKSSTKQDLTARKPPFFQIQTRQTDQTRLRLLQRSEPLSLAGPISPPPRVQ